MTKSKEEEGIFEARMRLAVEKAKLVLRKKEPKSLHLRPPRSSESHSHTELSWLTGKVSLTSYGLWH